MRPLNSNRARRNDFEVGRERGKGELEADLVVAFAGGAVGDGVGVFETCDLNLPLGDQRPGDAGAEKILIFVEGVGADHGENEIAGEFLGEIVDVALGSAGLEGLFVEPFSSSSWPMSAQNAMISAYISPLTR